MLTERPKKSATAYLDITNAQRAQIADLHATKSTMNRLFRLREDETSHLPSQLNAMSLLASYGLDPEALKDLSTRWTKRWTETWGDGAGKSIRVLYQW